MTQATQASPRTSPDSPLPRRQASSDLALGLIPLTTLTATTWWLFGLPLAYFGPVSVGYLGLAGLLIWYLPDGPRAQLGPANRVTLGRATLILPLSGLAMPPILITTDLAWYIIALATLALVLDGVDGWVARRFQASSSFGARFDMELDSFLMLVLSILVWRSGRVGAWAILIGLPRYLFVAAGWIWPWLRSTLPPSARRRAVCVVQGTLLLVCLGPIISPALATVAAAAAVAILTYSFAVDIAWLARRRPDRKGA